MKWGCLKKSESKTDEIWKSSGRILEMDPFKQESGEGAGKWTRVN